MKLGPCWRREGPLNSARTERARDQAPIQELAGRRGGVELHALEVRAYVGSGASVHEGLSHRLDEVFTLAESLGGVETLISHPAIMTHASVPKERRDMLGISDGLIRISVGIEDVDDLQADLSQALDGI